MAAELVQFAMNMIGSSHPVFLCCDSWYPKRVVLKLADQFSDLGLISIVRGDTVLC